MASIVSFDTTRDWNASQSFFATMPLPSPVVPKPFLSVVTRQSFDIEKLSKGPPLYQVHENERKSFAVWAGESSVRPQHASVTLAKTRAGAVSRANTLGT